MKLSYCLTALIMMCTLCSSTEPEKAAVTIGVFTDAHYSSSKENTAERHYKASKEKIREAVKTFNSESVDMAASLGDLVDNDYSCYPEIGELLAELTMPMHIVLGNHDFNHKFSAGQHEKNMKLLGVTKRYFSVQKDGFRLLFLDTSDIATYSTPFESAEYREAEEMLKTLKDEAASNAKKYNGAIGEKQLKWIEEELKDAAAKSQSVICFSHIPAVAKGADKYTLWNSEDLIDLIAGYPCVKAFVAGHHHAGSYSARKGIHYITLKGMVCGEENSYSIIRLYDNRIVIEGYGREDDREYQFR